MPDMNGNPTPEELMKRRQNGAAGAAGVIRNAITGLTAPPAPQVASGQVGAVDPAGEKASNLSLYSGSHPARGGASGMKIAKDNGTLGIGIGTRDVRPTGVIREGQVDPNTGMATGGVVRAAEDEYDPAAFANQAGAIQQAPTVTGNPVVGATGNAIVQALTNGPNPMSNPYIQQGQAADAGDKNRALGAANALGGAGATNADRQGQVFGTAAAAQQPAVDAQNWLIGQLTSAAAGQGPSAAAPLFQQNLDKVIGATAAQAANVRGAGAVSAANTASQVAGQAGLEAASQSAQLRAQEQQAAQQNLISATGTARSGATALSTLLGNVAGTARSQDVDSAKAFSDAMQGIRDGSIKSTEVAVTATNALNATNGQLGQWAVQNGLDFGKLLQSAQSGDQTAALQLTQIMAQYDIQKYGITKQGNVAERGQNVEPLAGAVGGGSNAAGASVIKAIAK